MEKYYKRVFAKPQVYRGITFRSTLERDFAMLLDGKIVKYKNMTFSRVPVDWTYESTEFELLPQKEWIDRTELDLSVKKIIRNKKHILQRVIYTPDFILPNEKLIVEVKGKQFDDNLFHLRLRLFKHFYPKYAIWVVKSHTQFGDLDKVLENIKIGVEQDGLQRN